MFFVLLGKNEMSNFILYEKRIESNKVFFISGIQILATDEHGRTTD